MQHHAVVKRWRRRDLGPSQVDPRELLLAEPNVGGLLNGPIGWVGVDQHDGYFDGLEANAALTGDAWRGTTDSPGYGERMAREDSAARSIFEEWVRHALNSDFAVQPGDPDDPDSRMHAAFVERCFWEISRTTFNDQLRHAMWCLVWGCSLDEPIYRRRADDETPTFELVQQPGRAPKWVEAERMDVGHIVLEDLAPRRPTTIIRWYQDPETGAFGGVYQYSPQDDTARAGTGQRREIFLPADRVHLHTNAGNSGNWEGEGLLRPGYLLWKARQVILRMGVIGAERFGVGVPVARETVDPTTVIDKGLLAENWRKVQSLIAAYRGGSQAWLAVPHGIDVTLQESTLPAADAIRELYNLLGVELHVLGKTQHLIQGMTGVGTYSLREGQAEDFRATLTPLVESILNTWNRGVVRRLVDLNWDGVKRYPRLTIGDPVQMDFKAALEAYEIGVRGGAFHAQPDDEDYFRDMGGLPERADDDELVEEPDELPLIEGEVVEALSVPAQNSALNGAQVQAAMQIVIAVGAGDLSEEAAAAMLQSFFNLDPDEVQAMLVQPPEEEEPAPPESPVPPGSPPVAPPPPQTAVGQQGAPEQDEQGQGPEEAPQGGQAAGQPALQAARGCGCGGDHGPALYMEPGTDPAGMPPSARLRLLAESQFDARASRVAREDAVHRMALGVRAIVTDAISTWAEEHAEQIEAGDLEALTREPLEVRVAVQRYLTRGYQDVTDMGRDEVKREAKRMRSDALFLEQLQAAVQAWHDQPAMDALLRPVAAFAEKKGTGLTNAVDAMLQPEKMRANRDVYAATTAQQVEAEAVASVNTALQQVPAAEWTVAGVAERGTGGIDFKRATRGVTQDTNNVYFQGRASQGRIEGMSVAVYTLNPEIGIRGPHDPCDACVATAASADNPAVVGSDAEQRLVCPNPDCYSTLGGANTCWCSLVYVPANLADVKAAM